MIYLKKTFDSAARNIAYEQALLDSAEGTSPPIEILRIWQPQSYFVVLGRGGKVADDVYLDNCESDGISVIRRFSGGGTILTGPGCLMYSLILSVERNPALKDITFCHQHVGGKLQEAYAACGHEIESRGHSDLCQGDRKLSGNAMRLGRTHLIYHGTLLLDFDLERIPNYLKLPPRRPDYRNSRTHLDFVMNLDVDTEQLTESIRDVFGANEQLRSLEELDVSGLVSSRYGNPDWNYRF